MKRLLAALFCLLAAGPVLAGPWDETHRIIVKLRDPAESRSSSMAAAKVDRLSRAAGARLRHQQPMSGGNQLFLLDKPLPLAAVEAIIERLKRDPDVLHADPDRRVRPALTPNDASYGSQWHYFDPAASGYPGAANLPDAWSVSTGAASVVVAVLDTGKTSHAELNARWVGGYDFVKADAAGSGTGGTSCPRANSACTANDGDGRDSDPSDPGDWISVAEDAGTADGGFFASCGAGDSSWHGTHVAGTIGAAGNNGTSVAGINWVSSIVPVRVLGKCGGYDSDIMDAIRWAAGLSVSGVPANPNPAKVINLSLGNTSACNASYQSAVDDAIGAGAVVVAAAGNNNGSADSFQPASCTGVISVAAVRRDGKRASYSNTGTTVKIAAPGGQTSGVGADGGVLSTLDSGATSPAGGTTGGYQGTSMAAPHVAGVASLMLSVDPTLTPAQVLSRLQSTARSFIALDACTTSTCGAGILDAKNAVRGSVITPSIVTVQPATQGTSSVTWSWTVSGTADSYNVYDAVTSASLSAGQAGLSYTRTGLSANTLVSARVHGVRFTVEGSGTSSVSTATLPSPPSGTNKYAWISSATVTFAACGAGCSGYALTLFSDAAMTAVVGSSHVFNSAATSLGVTGLSTLTTYYAKIATINQSGGSSALALGSLYTGTNLVAPALSAPTGVSASGLTINWSANGNPGGTTFLVELSSVPGLGSGVASQSGADMFSAAFSGLQANTSYYYRVSSVGGAAASGGPASTHGLSPSGGAMVASGADGILMSWSANGNAPNSAYLAQISVSSSFASIAASSATRNLSALLSGLPANALYYGRVWLLPNSGANPGALALGSAATPAAAVTAPAFTSVGQTQAAASWGAGTNAYPGTTFLAQIATDTTFGGALLSSQTASLSAQWTGLTPGQRYFMRAAALNQSGVAAGFVVSAATYTLPVPPQAAAVTLSSSTQTTLKAQWTQGLNGAGNQFTAELSLNPSFAPVAFTSVTFNTHATFTGLTTNTSYYLRVRTEGVGTNPDSAYTSMGYAGTTRPSLATVSARPFQPVGYTVVGATWVARPASPPSASAEGYRLELSTAMDFTGVVFSSTVMGSWSSTASVSGLAFDTQYYARVASLNRDGAASYAHVAFSTRTLLPRVSSAAVTAGLPLQLTVTSPPFQEFTSIQVEIPAGTFPQDTMVTVNASVGAELPSPFSSQGSLTSVGSGAGISIDAGGAQPAPGKKVAIRMQYDPAKLGSLDPQTIRLFRYDDATRQWTRLQGAVDAQARLVTGLTDHFSFFGAFAVQAGAGVESVQVFPIPWTPSSGDGRFNSAELTFGNLPEGGEVKLYSLGGELLWSSRADATGIVTWDGRTRYGRGVGTGTYLAVIEKGGSRVVKRVVVVR